MRTRTVPLSFTITRLQHGFDVPQSQFTAPALFNFNRTSSQRYSPTFPPPSTMLPSSPESKIELMAAIATSSSTPETSSSTAVPSVALSNKIPKMLRASAIRSFTFSAIEELNDWALFTILAAGRRCSPLSHGMDILARFITGYGQRGMETVHFSGIPSS